MRSSKSMRKTLSITSLGLMLGFAIALANANESTSPSRTNNGSTPGQVGETPPDSPDSSTMGTSSDAGSRVTEIDNMRSCTDRNGVTYRKGESGFKNCITWIKEQRKGEMGGQSGVENPRLENPTTPPPPPMTPDEAPVNDTLSTD